jgi:hypothetical protein
MTKLSPTQTDLLKAIAENEAGALPAPEGSKKAVSDLIKRGMLISVPQGDQPSNLMITNAGRAAVGAEPAPAAERPSAKPKDKPADPAPAAPKTPKGQIAKVLELLGRPQGATVPDIMEATGWQSHSVRGAMSGAIKKNLGIEITSEKTEAGRVYRITAETAA